MKILAIDIGSSSVKAAVLSGGTLLGGAARVPFATRADGLRVEVDADALLRAVADAIDALGASRTARVDAISPAAMSPSWVAIDSRRGRAPRAVTPIVTHQDRRSVAEAHEIERRVGRTRHLRLAGNRPFPGGISSTTWLWFATHERARLRRATVVGHATTLLHAALCGARAIDPSHASFTGLFSTLTLRGWNDELCDAIGIDRSLLPDVFEANQIAGHLTPAAARRFGALRAGTPVLAGCVDTSAVMLLAGARPGQLVNSCGSTDVLAVCTTNPKPHPRLLTRALGVGRSWMSVATLASAGSTIQWLKDTLFADLDWPAYARLLAKLLRDPIDSPVRFDPHLAGDRTSLTQPTASFTHLTLATTRETMLGAAVESLAAASAARLDLLRQANPGVRFRQGVLLTGGADERLRRLLHRDWPASPRRIFRDSPDATLHGLARLAVGSFR